jgi:hypothetical protein
MEQVLATDRRCSLWRVSQLWARLGYLQPCFLLAAALGCRCCSVPARQFLRLHQVYRLFSCRYAAFYGRHWLSSDLRYCFVIIDSGLEHASKFHYLHVVDNASFKHSLKLQCVNVVINITHCHCIHHHDGYCKTYG